jgi:DNA polymerase III epsilon subunit
MRHVVLDTETTNTDAKGGDRMIEIGAVELVNLRLTGRTFHTFLDPEGRDISFDSFKVHGLTKADLENAPRYRDIHDELMSFIDGDVVVIHNAPFDMDFLTRAAAEFEQTFDVDVVDTIDLASRRWPGMPVNLDAVLKRLGFVTDIPGLNAIMQGVPWDREIKRVDRADQHTALIDCIWLGHGYGHLAGAHQLEFGEENTRQSRPWPFARQSLSILPLEIDGAC